MATISLCMIVKNEEAVLERILEIMKDIADEIIIADTGSEDGTKDIAYRYTSNVFDFEWCDDFSAARNFVWDKAKMDYRMWLDADDVIREKWQKELKELKENIDMSTDVVMMKYVTGFDEGGDPSFFCYRERLIKNKSGYRWKGKVHEAVEPHGNVIYSDIEIEHRKIKEGYRDRNIKIYENMIKRGERLEPRDKFYYGRELYYNGRYEEGERVLIDFLREGKGWTENNIDACLQLSYCYEKTGEYEKRMKVLFYSFYFDMPRAEICCEVGRAFMEKEEYEKAVYWYGQALRTKYDEHSGGFVQKDFYDYIPAIQLCVCYDRMGEYEKAFEYHMISKKIKPEAEEVKFNEKYFKEFKELGARS